MVKPVYSRGKYARQAASSKSKSKSRSASAGAAGTSKYGKGSKYGKRKKSSGGVPPMVFVTGGVILFVVIMAVLVAGKKQPERQKIVQHVQKMPPKRQLISSAISAVRSNMPGSGSFASAGDATYEVSDLGGRQYQVTGFVTRSNGDYEQFTVHLRQRSSGLSPEHIEVGSDVIMRRGKRAIFK